jgi:hypothetical protein
MAFTTSVPQKLEKPALMVLEKLYRQCQNKKTIARIIIVLVIGIAVIQELFTKTGLTKSWLEITIYLLFGFYGLETVRSCLKSESTSENSNNSVLITFFLLW